MEMRKTNAMSFVFGTVVMVALIVGGAYAYFVATEQGEALEFASGTIEISSDELQARGNNQNLLPGENFTMVGKTYNGIKNTGTRASILELDFASQLEGYMPALDAADIYNVLKLYPNDYEKRIVQTTPVQREMLFFTRSRLDEVVQIKMTTAGTDWLEVNNKYYVRVEPGEIAKFGTISFLVLHELGGNVDCSRCPGTGVSCTSCSGTGKITCSLCAGSGHTNSSTKCTQCNGKGSTTGTCSTCSGAGHISVNGTCSDCSGSGNVTSNGKCHDCDGQGHTIKTTTGSCKDCNGKGHVTGSTKCGTCSGHGKVTTNCGSCGSKGKCGTCSGKGQIFKNGCYTKCTACSGNGKCKPCGGHGSTSKTCTTCSGHGSCGTSTKCSGCKGSGSTTTTTKVTCTKCDGKGNSSSTTSCKTCSGHGSVSGKVTCTDCSGKGQANISCTGCNGSGSTGSASICTRCSGHGKITCTNCGGGGSVTPNRPHEQASEFRSGYIVKAVQASSAAIEDEYGSQVHSAIIAAGKNWFDF